MENPLFLMGKSTISMAIFNSYVSLPEGSNFFFGGARNQKDSQWLIGELNVEVEKLL